MAQVDLSSESKMLNTKSKRGLVSRLAFTLLIFAVASIGAGVFLFLSPLGQVSIDMRLQSSSGGFSQLFFTDIDDTFVEERSEKELIIKGDNFLKFAVNPIRRTLGDQLRWDPLNTPAEITLSEIYVQAGLSRTPVPFRNLQPSIGMSAFTENEQGLNFTVETNDSQVLMQFELQDLYRDHVRNVLVAALLIGVASSALVFFVKQTTSQRSRKKQEESFNSPAPYPIATDTPTTPWWVHSLVMVLLAGIGLMVLWVIQLQ